MRPVPTGAHSPISYQTAEPFPHIVIDDFLPPDILRKSSKIFHRARIKKYFDRGQERLKYQYQPQDISSGLIRNLFAELNGQGFSWAFSRNSRASRA